MASFDYKGVRVMEANALKDSLQSPALFAGCKRVTEIVAKRNIPEGSYWHVYTKQDAWIECSAKYNLRKVLVSEAWLRENHFLVRRPDDRVQDTAIHEDNVRNAPPILELEDNEKFKDVNGIIINVEVRGERHPDKVFFKAHDVGEMLGRDRLRVDQLDLHSPMDFISFSTVTLGTGDNNAGGPDRIFLTYRGLLKVLFRRRHPIANRFVDWAVNVVYTAHLGTTDQRHAIAANIIGVPVDVVTQFCRSNPDKMPCVYTYVVGKVGDLREALDIPSTYPDDHLVIKYGRTEDLDRRTKEHNRNYGRLVGNNLSLKYWVPIDPRNQSEAETDLRLAVSGGQNQYVLKHPKYNELVILSSEILDFCADTFKAIGRKYSGGLKEFEDKLKLMEERLEQAKIHDADQVRLIDAITERANDCKKHVEEQSRILCLLQEILQKK